MSKESSNLEQLQQYIARRIIDYFSRESESITSRYVLYFDSFENILKFNKELTKLLSNDYLRDSLIARIGGDANLELILDEPFQFFNDDNELEYEATQIKIKNVSFEREIIFIADCDDDGKPLGDAFKNGIRNKFVDEKQDKILFYLSVQNIASVSKTTENFQKQGMPLSVKNVYENLCTQVSIIDGKNQQAVVLYALKKIKANKPQNDTSLLEFAPIIRIIESKLLAADDFHDLHMFQMSLTDLGKKDKALAENYKLYREVSLALADQELDSTMSSYDPKIINDIKKAYEKNEDNWDLGISFEHVQKHKKTNQKKFKLEKPPIVLDKDDNYLSHDYYLDFVKGSNASYIFMIKDYPGEKKFGLEFHFTQKATPKSDEFIVQKLNSKMTSHKVIIEGDAFYKKGLVIFEGAKGKISVSIAVINVSANFFADTCVGFTMKKNDYVFNFVANNYVVDIGDGDNLTRIEYDVKPDLPPLLVNSDKRNQIFFRFPEGEVAKESRVKFNIDDAAVIDASIRFEEPRLMPIEFYKIFNQCMLNNDCFYLDDGVLCNKHKHSEKYSTEEFDVAGKKYSINELLELEDEIIKNKYFHVKTKGLKVIDTIECNIPDDVRICYENICRFFERVGTTPSICTINNELLALYRDYINTVLKYTGKNSKYFQDKQSISNDLIGLFKIGLIIDADGLIWVSPLNPLSVAYQIELRDSSNKWVELDSYLYGSLGFGNMLPFMMDSNEIVYQAIKGEYPIQWACYCDASESIKGEANTYYQKIEDYYLKFFYLFEDIANRAFIINVIGIQHTTEIIKALFKLYNSKHINSKDLYLDINYYFSGTGKNEFDNMTEFDYIHSFAKQFTGYKNSEDVDEFCDWYSDHVKYYSKADKGIYDYAHISFCAFQSEKKSSLSNTISSSKSGIMLNGLISDVPSTLDKESGIYKYGFGAQYTEDRLANSLLANLAFSYNELAVCKAGSPATRDMSIAQGVQNTKSDKLDAIYKASNWVVFVEPKIDLDFFIEQDDTKEEDLIIIHYPDKNVTSAGYTSITVTQKSEQYINVISEYLHTKLPYYSQTIDVKKIIKNFNAYSGEWLMNFINNKQVEEKISLVSAIGFCREYFPKIYPEYTWVPIALDEVLRVTGSIGGTLTNVLFSKKVLINRGIIESQNATSDDLLMAGIKENDGKLYLRYIPIEVKHGNCDSKTKQDAHSQVINTAELIKSSFVDNEDAECRIDKKIYRNYMIQHVISNAEKMLAYKITDSKDYRNIIDSIMRIDLLNDNYELEHDSSDIYAFYFVEGQTIVSKVKNNNDNVIELSVPISEMYRYLVDDNHISSDADALYNTEMNEDTTTYDIERHDDELGDDGEYLSDTEGDRESDQIELELNNIGNTNISPKQDIQQIDELNNDNADSSVRILIGEDTSANKIYWEFGNNNLANRHLLITGSSGQGKTYCIQTLLYELLREDVPSLIFDYSDSYKMDQLDEHFINQVSNRLDNRVFYFGDVPINPFVRHEIEIGGITGPEKESDVAARFAEILVNVYKLGDQQRSAVFTAVLNGLKKYGENMDMRHFRLELEDLQETNKTASSVISKMEPFFESITFQSQDTLDWGQILYNNEAKVTIFQLTGISRDNQKILTELFLWDAWYYTKKNGTKDKPFVVVLDEAQNLSHKENSPSKMILTEGRKFGWSAWFATQSLKVLDDDSVTRLNQAACKLFFKPTEDEFVKVSKLIDASSTYNWLPEIQSLEKGQCIFAGPRVKANGVFGPAQPSKVNVSSFEQRIV